MAAVSSLSNGKGLVTASNDEQNQWDFSISSQPEHQGQPEHHSNGVPYPTRSEEMESSPGSNAVQKSSRSKGKTDPNYLSPYKQGLKGDYSGSRSGSEPDSLLDLYKQRNSMREKSIDSPAPSPRHPYGTGDTQMDDKDNDPDQSRWIHKDKLAEIERREMEAAGIVPPPTRSKSRSRRAQSPEKDTNGPTNEVEEALPVKEKKRRKIQSPVEQEREPEVAPEPEAEVQHEPEVETELEESAEQIQPNEFDVRTPEEIAAEAYMIRTTSPVYRGQQGLRASSSRIPLPRSSPMPLPQEHLERSTPLPRKRGQSGDWDGEDSIVYHRSRSRGNSVGSQVLLDDIDTPTHGPTRLQTNNSPSKSRTPSISNKHTRKPSMSTPNSSQKPHSASTPRSPSSGPSIRPKSRSGLEPRPPTAINRPEGDAPWLKDMYKPDPMLPPDQQLLPTHAKRLQEEARRKEQWEQAKQDSEARKKARREDDSTGGGDDSREFSPLAEYTAKGLQPTPNNENGKSAGLPGIQGDNNPEWPLTRGTPTGSRPPFDDASSGPGTGPDKIGNAGYSAMPRVRPGVNGEGQLLQPGDNYRATVTSPNSKSVEAKDPFEKERIGRNDQEDDAEKGRRRKKDKSGGCCGCVVM